MFARVPASMTPLLSGVIRGLSGAVCLCRYRPEAVVRPHQIAFVLTAAAPRNLPEPQLTFVGHSSHKCTVSVTSAMLRSAVGGEKVGSEGGLVFHANAIGDPALSFDDRGAR